eukprot:jgi/Botrbrau1/11617/Bobra.0209s0008.1
MTTAKYIPSKTHSKQHRCKHSRSLKTASFQTYSVCSYASAAQLKRCLLLGLALEQAVRQRALEVSSKAAIMKMKGQGQELAEG